MDTQNYINTLNAIEDNYSELELNDFNFYDDYKKLYNDKKKENNSKK
jgi:hypothetical protein